MASLHDLDGKKTLDDCPSLPHSVVRRYVIPARNLVITLIPSQAAGLYSGILWKATSMTLPDPVVVMSHVSIASGILANAITTGMIGLQA